MKKAAPKIAVDMLIFHIGTLAGSNLRLSGSVIMFNDAGVVSFFVCTNRF